MQMTTLICPECQHENESERIYCHSCGARLDRSVMAGQKSPQEKAKDAQRRIRKMLDPQRAKLRQTFFNVCKLILGACVAAALVEITLPPDVPPPTKAAPRQINLELENAAYYHRPPELQYSQEEANAYLAYVLKGKRKLLDKPLLTFNGATVIFREGACDVTAERSLFGYSLYSSASYRLTEDNGKLAAVSNGGAIGRLPIHPQLMQFADILFADIWSALERERKLIAKMHGVDLHQGKVVFLATPSS